MDDCVFCKIVAGEAPASLVYEDAEVAAFMDMRPVTKGHTLVIPKSHAKNIDELDRGLGGRLFDTALDLSRAIRESVGSDGVNLFVADGEAAGQEVFHFHLHIIPRFEGDGFGLKMPSGYPATADRGEFDRIALTIRERLVEGGCE